MCCIVPLHETERRSWISQVQNGTHHRRIPGRRGVLDIYRPQRSCEGYIFTPVCHSVRGGGGGSSSTSSSPCIRVKFKLLNPNLSALFIITTVAYPRGALGTHSPSWSNFFYFIQFILDTNNCEIIDCNPLKDDNPGSATEKVQPFNISVSLMIQTERL